MGQLERLALELFAGGDSYPGGAPTPDPLAQPAALMQLAGDALGGSLG